MKLNATAIPFILIFTKFVTHADNPVLPAKASVITNQDGSITYITGNGSIAIETGNPGLAYQEFQDFILKSNITVNSYNLNQLKGTNLKSINLQVTVETNQSWGILKKVAQLGESISESYNESKQIYFPPEVLGKEIQSLKKELENIKPNSNFEMTRTLINKINDAEARQRNAKNTASTLGNHSRLSITIQSKGFAEYQIKEQQKAEQLIQKQYLRGQPQLNSMGLVEKYLNLSNFAIFIVSFFGGGFALWLYKKKQ